MSASVPPSLYLAGQTLAIEAEPAELVCDLKLKIAESEWGVPPCQQRLLLAGRSLDDEQTLSNCGLRKESMIYLMLRLRGGTSYLCGDCGKTNEIKPKDPIRCRFCGCPHPPTPSARDPPLPSVCIPANLMPHCRSRYRILYKMRTKNLIQFEAR